MLISKFTTSQTGKKTITICVLPDISISKGNQTMKFGQFIEYNMWNIFFEKNHAENETGRLASDFTCFFKKLCMR